MTAQRFSDALETEFYSSTINVENIKYHGVPDADNTYHFRFNFSSNHAQSAIEDFVKDVADDLSGGLTYDIMNVRKQTRSEYVFIVKISP